MRFELISTGVLLAGVMALAGCMSSPTYGTGVTANEQLLEDIGSSMKVTPKKPTGIVYEPRPELLKTAEAKGLPEPQQNVTKQQGVWPESPEQQRARLRKEATDAQGDQFFVPTIKNDISGVDGDPYAGLTGNELASKIAVDNAKGAGAEVKKRRALNAAGSPTSRHFLSEPPLEYRQPATTATYGDLGEDEYKKERAARAAAKKGKFKWPWE